MQREALRSPASGDIVLAHRRADIGLEGLGVAADRPRGGDAHLRMGLIGLLDDRADEASEVGQVAGQDGLAELDVGYEAAERVRGLMIGRRGEEGRYRRIPMRDRRQRQIFLALEVVEKASLGQAGRGADVLDTRCGIAFGAHDSQRRVEELRLGFVLGLHDRNGLRVCTHTNHLVWMSSKPNPGSIEQSRNALPQSRSSVMQNAVLSREGGTMKRPTGKVAWVTGAGSGIGEAG